MTTDSLSATFSALADPTRRAILARLASGEATVTELARPFDMSLPGISKHLKVLREAGLVTQGRDAQWRPCRLEPERLGEVAAWVEPYRVMWQERVDRMDAVIPKAENVRSDAGGEAEPPDGERRARSQGPRLDGGAPL